MTAAGLLLLFAVATAPVPVADPPGWVKQAIADPRREDAAAVILLDEQAVTVTADGKTRTIRRYVVRVDDTDGREAAVIRELYLTGSGKIRQVRGWIIPRSGSPRELGGRQAVDVALVNNDVFNEVRARILAPGSEIAPGDVFAGEIESEDRLLFAQMEWQMQHAWPARVARRRLTLPAGWTARSVVFNAPAIEPRREGASFTWEMQGLPALPEEPAMPPVSDLAPRVAVSIFGPDAAPAPGQFERWEQVAGWLQGLSEFTAQAPAVVAAKAREITAAATTDFERARLIGVFAQRIQYVSIQTGIGRGGGYQPRAPALVLERNYGDCKDKAGLMRSMLAAVGIKSHLVSIYAGDRNYVRANWPSPQQFNHAIIAVALDGVPARVSATLEHPEFGRLLMFDPTDEHTPFGALPLHEQGSLALLVTTGERLLVTMPVAPADAHRVERVVDGAIGAAGELDATVTERFSGEPGTAARAEHRTLDSGAYRARVQRRLGAGIPRLLVATVTTADDPAAGSVTVNSRLSAAGFAPLQAGLLLVVPPFARDGEDMPAPAGRKTAVRLEPRAIIETHRLGVPSGYEVDELPETVRLTTPFGEFELAYSTEGNTLIARRTLRIPLQTVAAADSTALGEFFGRVRAADATPALFVRRP